MGIKILKSLHGKFFGMTERGMMVAPKGFVAGGEDGASMYERSPDTVAITDDFLSALQQAGDTGIPIGLGHWRQVTGDTGHGSLNVAAANNGVFRLFNTPSATAALVAASGKGIAGALLWKGNMAKGNELGLLRIAARVKVFPDDGGSAISRTLNRLHAFIGFTDIATYEFPAYDTGAGFIANATDAMGFYLGAGADTGWSGVGVAAGVSQKVSLDPTRPVVNTYDVLEIEYRRSPSLAVAQFFINGVSKGKIETPVTPTVSLAPCIYAFQQDTGKQALDIDWINVAGSRDTGQ